MKHCLKISLFVEVDTDAPNYFGPDDPEEICSETEKDFRFFLEEAGGFSLQKCYVYLTE